MGEALVIIDDTIKEIINGLNGRNDHTEATRWSHTLNAVMFAVAVQVGTALLLGLVLLKFRHSTVCPFIDSFNKSSFSLVHSFVLHKEINTRL
jgi:hypothetical protein